MVDTATATLCSTAGGRRRARSGTRFLNCPSSSKEHGVSASCSIGRMLSGAKSAARRKLFRSEPDWLGLDWSDTSGAAGHHWWTTLENNFVLEASEDEYGGVVVDADRLPSDQAAFAGSLAASLSYWKSVGKKGVWLKLPVDRSEFVPIAVKEGFKYHHAEESYLMLTYWIPDEPSLLPANASHQVGVGGFVINDQMEVLVVQEKYRGSPMDGVWKLPTGFILASEEIFTGAIREVKEETGVDTEFVDVVAFRHAHNVAFQKSDLFFICMLRPVSSQIKIIDETEIQAAKWMPLEEFVKQPFIQEDHMFQKIMDICIQRLRKCYCGLTAHDVVSKFDGRASTLYYNVDEPEDVNCSAA